MAGVRQEQLHTRTGGTGPSTRRTPPLPPFEIDVVKQVAQDHPSWLASSCVGSGGTNEFLYEVVRGLRTKDSRWGLNRKRGKVGDLSQDVVDYHWGADASEGSTKAYIIDIITAQCTDSPKPGRIDVTEQTAQANTVGRWTLNGQNLGPWLVALIDANRLLSARRG